MKHLAVVATAVLLALAPAAAGARIAIEPQSQGRDPYCLAGAAAMVLSYYFPEGNDNGRFTIDRVVDDYDTFFDLEWSRGRPLDPGKLYRGITAYGVAVQSGDRWDWEWVRRQVEDGRPVIVYLYQNQARTMTDAFVLEEIGPARTYATSSYYGPVKWSTGYFVDNWDGWSTTIVPGD